MANWTFAELDAIRRKRVVGPEAERHFDAEMVAVHPPDTRWMKATKFVDQALDVKKVRTLFYDRIHVVDTTGCAIPVAAGKYPRICPWCKREMDPTSGGMPAGASAGLKR